MTCRLLIVALSLLAYAVSEAAAPLRVMSFNVRYGTAPDGDNHWEQRRRSVVDTIEAFGPDLLGVQEAIDFQVRYLQEELRSYVGFGRSRSTIPDEQCAVFYREDRFTRLAGGHFWLSETPESPGSIGWDAEYPRVATWVLLHDLRGGPPVLMLNTHFDHRGEHARRRSSELLVERLAALRAIVDDSRLVVMGDFNSEANSAAYRTLVAPASGLRDAYRAARPERSPKEGTFNGFALNRASSRRIDWILMGNSLKAADARIIRTAYDGRYPSDHFPVTAELHTAP
ncbi:MAG: endonuclease/exonuclease/phosphatase family protein [Planctomycetota bacterium]